MRKLLLFFLMIFFTFVGQSYAQNGESADGPIIVCPAGHFESNSRMGMQHAEAMSLRSSIVAPTADIQIVFGPNAAADPAVQAAFEYALGIWEREIISSVPIVIVAEYANLGAGVLASAGPITIHRDFVGAPETDTWYPVALANHLAGTDLNGPPNANPFADPANPDYTGFELVVNIGNGIPWYFGTDGNTTTGLYDFVTVALHEAGHGLGFMTLGTVQGGLGYSAPSYFGGTAHMIWDKHFENSSGTNVETIPTGSSTLASFYTSNDLFISGPNAVMEHSGTRPKVYAPTSFQSGSSLSHWDESTYPAGNPFSLMSPQLGSGESIFDIGDITRGWFKDMGWTLNPNSGIPTPPTANCQDITVQLDSSGNAMILPSDVDNGSVDALGTTNVTLTLDIDTFNCSNIGANTVTLTVTDSDGVSSTCTATVTVEDNVAPTAICQDITIQLDMAGNAAITAGDVDGGSNDACGLASISAAPSAFTTADIGVNPVTLTVTDVNGNVSTCTANVTVEASADTTPPSITCPTLSPAALDINCQNAIPDYTGFVTVSDNTDPNPVITQSPAPGTIHSEAIEITMTATDASGNSSSCTINLDVTENIAPEAVCQDITIQLDSAGNATITAGDVDGGSTDNCGIASISASPTMFTTADIGDNTVTLTVTDNYGNTDNCTAIVTVEPAVPTLPELVINEVLVNPVGGDTGNEYIELRGTPNLTLPSNIYLLAIEGDETSNEGTVDKVFDLSGMTIGSNGFLVLLQAGNSYTPDAGATVMTATGTGWDGLSNSSSDIENGSTSLLLVYSSVTPIVEDVDTNDDATFDSGTSSNWLIIDSIAVLDGGASDISYAAIAFSNNGSGLSTAVIVNLQAIAGSAFTPDYLARNGDTSGSMQSAWVAADVLGTAPNYTIQPGETLPTGLDDAPLDHLGSTNIFTPPTCAISITTHPQDAEICEGDPLSFDVVATGTGTLSYQWQVNMGDGNFVDVGSPSANSELSFAFMNIGGDGNEYQVIVTSDNGTPSDDTDDCEIVSNVATLTVNPLPTVSFNAPTDVTIDVGVLAGNSGGNPVPTSEPGDSGTYSGPGVTDNGDGTYDFDPTVAGVGIHTITYTYTDGNGCSNSASDDIEVLPAVTTGSIQVILSATPEDGTDFPFTLTRPGNSDINNILDDDTDPTRSNNFTVSNLNPGSHDVTVSLPSGWVIDNVDIVNSSNNVPLVNGITVDLQSGEDVTATFHLIQSSTCEVAINIQPQDKIGCQDDNGSFSVEASGNGTLSYDWQSNSGGGFVSTGGTASTFPFIYRDYLDGYQYRVIITSDNGTPSDDTDDCSITSEIVTLRVNLLPLVAFTAPADLTVDAGVQVGLGGGTPVQGTVGGDSGVYSGPGVTDDGNGMTYSFDPTTAGVGIHTIVYTYMDDNGCSNSASDDVEVLPAVAQTGTITVILENVPDSDLDIDYTITGGLTPASFSLDDDADGTLPDFITFTDVPAGSYTLTQLANQGYFPIRVDWLENDPPNSTVDVSMLPDVIFNINLEPGEELLVLFTNSIDDVPPTITCPADIVVGNDPGECGAVVNFAVTAEDVFDDNPFDNPQLKLEGELQSMTLPTDNRVLADVTFSHNPGSFFPVGVTTVTATAIDGAGNIASCSFDVTVNDTEAPIAICQNISVTLDSNGEAGILPSDVDGGSSDNCPSVSLAIDKDTFTVADLGPNTVILTVTDASGNSASCEAIVTIEQDGPIECPDYLPNEDPAIVLPAGYLTAGADAVVGTTVNTYNSPCAIEVVNYHANQPWARYVIPIVLADYGINPGDRLFIAIDGNDGTGNARFEINQNNTPNTALGYSNFTNSWGHYETTVTVPSGITSLDLWFHNSYPVYGGDSLTAGLNGGSYTSYYDNLVVINLDAQGGNLNPVADAGPDQTVQGYEEPILQSNIIVGNVTLDGSGSYDSDGSIVSYEWSEGGTPLATGVSPTVVLEEGVHTITLEVTDNEGAIDTDTVVITVLGEAENMPPVANAGPDQTIIAYEIDDTGQLTSNILGAIVTLDGTGSYDPDGTIVSYEWTSASGMIDDGAIESVVLGVGVHTITLEVTDNDGATDTDTVVITVVEDVIPTECPDYLPNEDPGIVLPTGGLTAGADAVVGTNANTYNSPCGIEVVNNDSGQPWGRYTIPIVLSDYGIAAGDRLFIAVDGNNGTGNARFEINQNNSPNTALGSANFGSGWSHYETTVTVPSGINSLDLWFHSNYTNSGSGGTAYYDNLVVINLDAIGGNTPPIANAGIDVVVTDTDDNGYEDVMLDGTASFDPDGSITSWEWSKGATLLGTGATPTISFDVGIHTMNLMVTDNEGATDTDTVVITVVEDVIPTECPDYLPNEDPGIVLPTGGLTSGADAVVGTNANTNGSPCAIEVVNNDSNQPWSRYYIPIVLADYGINPGDRLFIGIDGNNGTGNAEFEINQNNTPNTGLGYYNFGSGWSRYETTIVVPSGITSLDLWFHSNYTLNTPGTAYFDNLVVVNLDDERPRLQADINNMFVSPNPANVTSKVSFEKVEDVEEILIFDMSGRMIQRFDAEEIKRGDHYEMDVYSIPVGNYIVRSRNTEGLEFSKQMVIER